MKQRLHNGSLFLMLMLVVIMLMTGCSSKSKVNSDSTPESSITEISAQAVLRTVTCDTVAKIQSAFANAQPGDKIVIKYTNTSGSHTYTNSSGFTISANGTSANPIMITYDNAGGRPILSTGSISSGTGLTITGDYITVQSIKVATAKKGIILDNSNYSTIAYCTVDNIGEEAIHLRDGSSNNTVKNCTITNTGRKGGTSEDYGEGVYVGSDFPKWDISGSAHRDPAQTWYNPYCDNNSILNNTIGPGVTAECIDIKEGVTGTIIDGNTFNGNDIDPGGDSANGASSFIDVKGNNTTITNNTGYANGNTSARLENGFENHLKTCSCHSTKWGNNNYYAGNTVDFGTNGSTSQYIVKKDSDCTGITHGTNTRVPSSGNTYNW